MTKLVSTNPWDNSVVGEVELMEEDEVTQIVLKSHIAQKAWKQQTLQERIKILTHSYESFKLRKEEIALLLAREMGMPYMQALDEVQYGFMYWKWYLANAEKYLSPEITKETEKELHKVYYEPKWVVVAIAPWNYPFSMFVWTSIQALLWGNTIIFKTSKETCITWKKIEEIMRASGVPDWVFLEVYGDGHVGDILAHQDIDFITFTGSTPVGKHLYWLAAEKMIWCVMELWGSAPGIVLEDAQIDTVLGSLYFLRFSNCWQMCDGLKRLIVHTSRYDELVEKLKILLESKKIGLAEDAHTDIGPMVSESQLVHLEAQVQDAIDKGASILAENIPNENLMGSYHSAMILWNITKDMLVWREEVFGPVLPIITFNTLEEAIELANETEYGLWGYIFTQDREVFEEIALQIESGEIQHNNLNYCIPESPFGGYKASGIGREHGHWGFHEFCNVKVLSIEK